LSSSSTLRRLSRLIPNMASSTSSTSKSDTESQGGRADELRRTPCLRTSENAQKAKFAEFLFYEVG
jgi:hypothetical protein